MLWVSKRTLREIKKTLLLFLYSYLSGLLIITNICIAYSSLENIFIYIVISGIKENSSTTTGLLNSLNSSGHKYKQVWLFFLSLSNPLQPWGQMSLPFPLMTPLANSVLLWLLLDLKMPCLVGNFSPVFSLMFTPSSLHGTGQSSASGTHHGGREEGRVPATESRGWEIGQNQLFLLVWILLCSSLFWAS